MNKYQLLKSGVSVVLKSTYAIHVLQAIETALRFDLMHALHAVGSFPLTLWKSIG